MLAENRAGERRGFGGEKRERERLAWENSLLIGLSRQVALAREMGVVANNMANVSTNGFKSRSPVFEEYLMPTGARGRVSTRRSPCSPT